MRRVSTGLMASVAKRWQPAAASVSDVGCSAPFTRSISSTASARSEEANVNSMSNIIMGQLQGMMEAGTYKHERVMTSPQSASVGVSGTEKEVLNFCANNYLGLSNHPVLVKAAIDTIKTHGYGLSSVRFICGTQDIHKELERKISAFHGTEDTILYPSCFDANAGLFEALLTPEDAVISDELNHASIIDGIRLCKAQRMRFKHMDLKDLEAKLIEAQGARMRLVVTDGVFSMDGDIAPLDGIVALAKKYKAYVFVDDCHATGFMGATGRGTDEQCNVLGQVDIINSTLGKALGGATGGYTTGKFEVIDLLRQKSRPYLFSNTLAPAVVGASIATFDLLSNSKDLRLQLYNNTAYFRQTMTDIGFNLHPGVHPIVPLMLGDAALAQRVAAMMLERGVYVVGFCYPVVPKGKARIRIQISAGHTREQLDTCIAAFISVGKELGLIKGF